MQWLIAYISGLVVVVCYLIIEPRYANKYLSFLTMADERKVFYQKFWIVILWPFVLAERVRKFLFFVIPIFFAGYLFWLRGDDKSEK